MIINGAKDGWHAPHQVPITISSTIPASMERDDPLERIGKLKELLDKEAITEAEFAEKKAKLLAGVSAPPALTTPWKESKLMAVEVPMFAYAPTPLK